MSAFDEKKSRRSLCLFFGFCFFWLLPFHAHASADLIQTESGTAIAGVTTTLHTYRCIGGTSPVMTPYSLTISVAAAHGTATVTPSSIVCGSETPGSVVLAYTPNKDHAYPVAASDTFTLNILRMAPYSYSVDYIWTVTIEAPPPSSPSSLSPSEVPVDKAADVKSLSVSVTKTILTLSRRLAGIMKPKGRGRGNKTQKSAENSHDASVREILASRDASHVGLRYDGSSVGIGAGDEIKGFALKTTRDFGITGLSAGGITEKGIGLWINASYTRSHDKNFFSQSAGDTWMVVAGVDKKIRENAAVGLAFTYEINNTVTNLSNAGAGSAKSTARTVAPYGIISINDSVTVDATVGFSRVNNEKKSADGVTSLYDATRYFTAFNLNGYIPVGAFDFSSTFGLMSAWERQNVYVDSAGNLNGKTRSKLSQISLTGELSYPGETIVPYTTLRLEKDLRWTDVTGINHDKHGATIGAGARFNMGDLTGELNGETDLARSQYDMYSLMGNLRYAF